MPSDPLTIDDILSGAVTSLLSLTGAGLNLSKWALRGVTADLQPLDQSSQIERDVNGNAMDLSAPEFHKYALTIGCNDQESPGFAAVSSEADGIWPGTLITVTLPPQLGSAEPITLDMMVTKPWRESRDEYGAITAWQLDLEEV